MRARISALEAELQEARDQQTATAEVLGVINSSPGDLPPVFDAILEKAVRVCKADQGLMYRREGDAYRPVAHVGLSEEYVATVMQRAPRKPGERTLVGMVAVEGRIVHIADIAADAEYERREAITLGMARTGIGVPLLHNGQTIGVFGLSRRRVEPFSDKQIALLQNFAAQAVIAMENARLITETREALDQQTATAEVLGVINSSPGDLMPVFDAILEKAHALCGAATGSLQLDDGEFVRAVATRGLPDEFVKILQQPRRTGFRDAFLRGAPFVQITDLADPVLTGGDDTTVAGRDIAGVRTLLRVPLRKDNALLGWIVAGRREVRPFTDQQIALLQNFAAQAVVAMENARLLTETREALDQQTATAEVLGVINASPGDLAPVFDAMLERAMRLCEAAFGALLTYHGGAFHSVAECGIPQAFSKFLRQPLHPAAGNSAYRMVNGEAVVQITDLHEDEATRHGDPARQAVIEKGGARTQLMVALRKDDVLLGMIVVYRQEVRPFTEKQIALLENFAAQAVIAMENARLITETREALEQQTATAEVLGVINSSPGDLAPVFDAILEKAMRLCETTFGHLMTWDGDRFHRNAFRGMPEDLLEEMRQPMKLVPGSFIDQVVQGKDLVCHADLHEAEAGSIGPGAAALMRFGARARAMVALRKDERLLGTITVYRTEARPFTEKQIALLQNFAAQAVIAMENARLITETREALEQQTAVSDVLQVINSSSGDLGPVFDAMLEKALDLCGAAFGVLWQYDGDRFHAAASRGVSAAFAEALRTPIQSEPGAALYQLERGEPLAHFSDITVEEAYRSGAGRAAVEMGGARTLLALPLRRDDKTLLGAFATFRQEVQPFSDKQIALLQNFAAQAVIAIENARLLGELRQRTEEVADLNRGLEARVAEQVEELGRVGRLKRFLAPQLAELIVSQGNENILESHRREIVVVFCDLRGYTAFSEAAEPEEVLDFLREYHGALGPLVAQFEGTLDQFSGDGIMVFFNDPVPIPDPAERAVKMSVAMREAAGTLIASWRQRGRELGFGIGIAQGYATLGQIGFSDRSGYTAIGTVCNVAARLCAEAKDGQILLSQRVNVTLRGSVATEQFGALTLKGLTQPVVAYNVPLAATQPALRVIEGGPQSV